MLPKQLKLLSTTEVKRESKSFEAVQQGVVIALLNYLGYSVEIKHPERLASKTIQFLIVNELYYEGKPLNFGDEVEAICNERYEGEKILAPNPKKVRQTRRHKDINRSALTFNRLLKYVEDRGFTIKRRYTKSSFKTLRMEKITEISVLDKVIIDLEQIHDIGKKINSAIVKTFKKGPYKTTLIEKKNDIILDILQTIPYFKQGVISPDSYDSFVKSEQRYFSRMHYDPSFYTNTQSLNEKKDEFPPQQTVDRIYDITNERIKDLERNNFLTNPNQHHVKYRPFDRSIIEQSDSVSQFVMNERIERISPTYELNFKQIRNEQYPRGSAPSSNYFYSPLYF
ncbi:TATA-binding protein-associated phosphoprotein [Entamoeba marina]